jgi:hypothetical protein
MNADIHANAAPRSMTTGAEFAATLAQNCRHIASAADTIHVQVNAGA